MRILDADVEWYEEVGNDPRLQVVVDEVPAREDLRFQHDDGIYCGILDGYVDYYAWSGDGNDGGYGGVCITIQMGDDNVETLHGPWSSRAGQVNLRRFGPIVDVDLTSDPTTTEQGYPIQSGALTLAAAKQAIDRVSEPCHLERRIRYDSEEPVWIPVRTAVRSNLR
jgi:hypothetical protein